MGKGSKQRWEHPDTRNRGKPQGPQGKGTRGGNSHQSPGVGAVKGGIPSVEAEVEKGHSSCQTSVNQGGNTLTPFLLPSSFLLATPVADEAQQEAHWQGNQEQFIPFSLLVHRTEQRRREIGPMMGDTANTGSRTLVSVPGEKSVS